MQKQNKTFNRKNAFTLAEVLITLALMGTLMALTIPTLMNSSNKGAYVNGLKKTYGLLDTATNQIMMNNSSTFERVIGGITLLTNYCNILECNKTCLPDDILGNCWASSNSKLSGGALVETFDPELGGNYGAVLSDGTFIILNIANDTCPLAGVSINLPYTSDPNHRCGNMYVDINGFKGPNTFGRDIFWFYFGPKGLVPGGDPHTNFYDLTVNCSTSNTTHDGRGCAGKVLTEGAMNY